MQIPERSLFPFSSTKQKKKKFGAVIPCRPETSLRYLEVRKTRFSEKRNEQKKWNSFLRSQEPQDTDRQREAGQHQQPSLSKRPGEVRANIVLVRRAPPHPTCSFRATWPHIIPPPVYRRLVAVSRNAPSFCLDTVSGWITLGWANIPCYISQLYYLLRANLLIIIVPWVVLY